jgi:hypothetical protein
MKIGLLILITILSYNLLGQTKTVFMESDFPKDKFIIKKEKQALGTISVDIVQVSPISHDDPNQFYCRTWLTVKYGDKLIKEQYEKDIEPVGDCFGFSFPERQPSSNILLLSRFGGYDGRIYTITNKGEFSDYAGGSFYVSSDNEYIFSNHHSDLPGVTIIDLNENKLIFSGELEKYISDWYFQDGKYFAVIDEDGLDSKTKLTFDFKTKKFEVGQLTNNVDIKNKLKLYNDPRERHCSCGK